MVDDNKLGLGARRVVMEELGYKVFVAVSPEEALSVLEAQTVDLVITDYRMPTMTGTELIAQMRARGLQQPVVIISGFVDALGLTEANTGADMVIQKSAHEVALMVRSVKNLLKPKTQRKPMSKDSRSAKSLVRRQKA
ncbi:MAG: response regulator [Acidobacteriota bacterium]